MAGVDSSRFVCTQPEVLGYGDAKYWKLRYVEKVFEPFDWYLRWDQLKELVSPHLKPDAEVLILGCGTSPLAEQILAEGLASSVTCVDQCGELVEALSQKHQDKAEKLKFEALGANKLPQDWAGRFDVVVDKAMLDCIIAGRQGTQQAQAVLQAASATLKSGGRYVCVSHAGPMQRLPLLGSARSQDQDLSQEFNWRVSCHTVPRPLADPGTGAPAAKGGKAPKDASELTQSAAFDAEANVYHIYICAHE